MNPSHPAVGTAYYRTPLRDRAIRASGQYRRPTMPKVSPPLGSQFRALGAGESVVWDRPYRQLDRVNGGIS